jgi:hypothetical protein
VEIRIAALEFRLVLNGDCRKVSIRCEVSGSAKLFQPYEK